MRGRMLLAGFVLATSTIATPFTSAGAVPPTPVLVLFDGAHLVKAGLDGSTPTTFGTANVPVSISPDGTKVLEWLQAKSSFIRVIGIDGTVLLDSVTDNGAFAYAWAPDSRMLVGWSLKGLFTFDTTTGVRTEVPGTAGLTDPRWSVDGTFIMAKRAGAWVSIRPDGSARTPFTGPRPDSPNGRWSLDVDEANHTVSIIDVITGDREAVATLLAGVHYVGWTWGPVDDTSIELFVSKGDLGVAGSPQTVQRIAHSLTTHASTWTTVATNRFPFFVGGVTPADVNGAPPAVTGLSAAPTPSTVTLSWTPPAGITDFAGVEVRYALGATPPATPTDGIDAGRTLASTISLGPLPPDQPVAVSVFSRDWSGNAGPAASAVSATPHLALTELSATATPADVKYGSAAAITVRLRLAHDGSGVAGSRISVERRRWNTSDPWTTIGALTTSALGGATMRQAPSVSYEYRFVDVGDADHTASSASARIRVAPVVRLVADRLVGRAGTVVHLTASTTPRRANVLSTLQRCTTVCVDVGPHLTAADGTVVYSLRMPPRGTTVRYVVRVSGSGSNLLPGTSNQIALTGT